MNGTDLDLPLASRAELDLQRRLARCRRHYVGNALQARLDIAQAAPDVDLELSLAWDGLAVDADLRWFLLQRLTAYGWADDAAVDAELAQDDTATGRRQAALARASMPTMAAKERAWVDIVQRTDLPNALLEATMAGFPQPNQRDLLLAFRERYFTELPQVWAERTMEMAQEITVGMYPFLLADEETVRLTQAYLDGDRQAAERRLVIEGRDGVERSIRAMARDA